MVKKLAIVLGIVVAVILVTAGVGYYLITRPSRVQQQAVSMDISDETAQRAENKIEEFTAQLSSASRGELISITLADEEVTSIIVKELKTNSEMLPLEVQNPRIMFVNDKILVSGDVSISGFQTNIAIQARAEVQDKQIKLTIEQLNIGKLPLPDAVLNRIKENLIPNKEILIDMNQMDIPIDLKDIRIENGQVVLVGLAR